ncbi:hypothetical protein [Clostridium ihumii]|uniref:hypothetical protein n=1 Tax=Clostridium ihumii TaxID=1470356 RepID=UPI00058C0C49|nr:hypothetical protein [Clostridium ihumii]
MHINYYKDKIKKVIIINTNNKYEDTNEVLEYDYDYETFLKEDVKEYPKYEEILKWVTEKV